MLRPWSDRSSEWFEECFRASGGGEKNKKGRKWFYLEALLWSEGSDGFLFSSFLLSFCPLPPLSFLLSSSFTPL